VCCRSCPTLPGRKFIGVRPDLSAAFAERMVAPTRNVVALPAGTPAEVGSLVEPLAVGHHAVQRADLTGDDRVLVVGGGPIGQAAALAARRLGGATVVVAELDTVRRDLLTRLGFDTVDSTTQSVDDITAVLGARATVVVDAVGTSRTLQAQQGRGLDRRRRRGSDRIQSANDVRRPRRGPSHGVSPLASALGLAEGEGRRLVGGLPSGQVAWPKSTTTRRRRNRPDTRQPSSPSEWAP
jgi:threonine dehydrogenase-like Zn-dependent dehydrogenase